MYPVIEGPLKDRPFRVDPIRDRWRAPRLWDQW